MYTKGQRVWLVANLSPRPGTDGQIVEPGREFCRVRWRESGEETMVPASFLDERRPRGAEDQESVAAWADKTFGPCTPTRAARRAAEEMQEFWERIGWGLPLHLEELTDDDRKALLSEGADVVITLLRFAATCGLDLQAEVDRKMAVNRGRRWVADGTGCGYHVKPGATVVLSSMPHRPPDRRQCGLCDWKGQPDEWPSHANDTHPNDSRLPFTDHWTPTPEELEFAQFEVDHLGVVEDPPTCQCAVPYPCPLHPASEG